MLRLNGGGGQVSKNMPKVNGGAGSVSTIKIALPGCTRWLERSSSSPFMERNKDDFGSCGICSIHCSSFRSITNSRDRAD